MFPSKIHATMNEEISIWIEKAADTRTKVTLVLDFVTRNESQQSKNQQLWTWLGTKTRKPHPSKAGKIEELNEVITENCINNNSNRKNRKSRLQKEEGLADERASGAESAQWEERGEPPCALGGDLYDISSPAQEEREGRAGKNV